MKKILITIICTMLLLLSGCVGNGERPKIKLDGFSAGVLLLDTDLDMGYGQPAEIKAVVPVLLFNFAF